MAVYLIRAGEAGPVKIGYAADIAKRINDLQGGCWEELKIQRSWDGGFPTEKWLHNRFKHLRIRGEWFLFDDEMLSVEPPELSDCPTTPAMLSIRAQRGLMSKVARGLGLTRAAISLWKRVPGELVVEVERITGIPREKLRPDMFRVGGDIKPWPL